MHMKRNVWVAGTWKPGTEVHLADEIVVYRADFLEVPSGLAFFFINVPPYLDQVSDEFANDCDNKAWNFIVSRIHSPLPQDEVFVEFCQSHQINDTPVCPLPHSLLVSLTMYSASKLV